MNKVGRYEVVDVLGEGGMGQVLRAWDPKLQQHVALKVINPALIGKEKVQVRAARELNVMLSLRSHPNIVTVLDYVEEPFALVMELIDGEELAEVIARNPQGLPVDMIYDVASAMVGALGFAHEKEILHRDMKPGNVMVMTLAQKQEVKVLDFGLAGFLSSDVKLTRTGARMGTPGYMAPEQHLGTSVDGRTDIYAMGVILYEMATGQSPFKAYTGTDYQLMKAQLELPMPRPSHVRPDIPVALEEMILKATAREPAERYQNAGEFLADIKGASSGGSVDYGLRDKTEPSSVPARGAAPPTILEGEVPASPQTRGGVSDASPTPSRAWIWVLLAILLLGGGATALILTNSKQQDELDKQAKIQKRKARRLRLEKEANDTRARVNQTRLAELERQRREGKLTEQELKRKKAELAKKVADQQARDKKSKEDAERQAQAAREQAERAKAEEERKRREASSDCGSSQSYAGTWKLTTVVTESKKGRSHSSVGTNGFYTLTLNASGNSLSGSLRKEGYGKVPFFRAVGGGRILVFTSSG
jgi:serine/threonine protein kinase